MTAWLQRTDFSSDELILGSADEALAKLRDFDWEVEQRREEQALADGEDCCPAGLGMVSERKDILHIIPQWGDTVHIHFHHTRRKSLLGFLRWNDEEVLSVTDFPTRRLLTLLQWHFDGGRQDEMVSLLKLEGTPVN